MREIHPLSINEVTLFNTRDSPIYVESAAKLRMMFCTIALVFNDLQGSHRVYQFYTKYTIVVTTVYAVLCVKLVYSLRPLKVVTRPLAGS